MKKVISCLFIAFPILCFSQWNAIYNHADHEVAMEVLNTDTIITVTDWDGRIHRSTDGGNSWSFFQTMFTTSWFYDVHFPTQEVGYACGGTAFGEHTNVIVKTTDGGQTWDSLTSNDYDGYSFSNIHFINEDIGFVSPQSNGLLKTIDGGISFTELTLSTGIISVGEIVSTPNQTVFISTREFLIPTDQNVFSILKSTDLGNNWTTVLSDTMSSSGSGSRMVSKMFFLDNTTGFAVGGNGLFLKTTDGGLTWATSFIHPYTHLSGLHFTSENVGYTNNAGGIYKTIDGGINWTVQNVSPLSIIGQLQFANDTLGFALGQDAIYRTTNAGDILNISTSYDLENFIIFPNPASSTISIMGLQNSVKVLKIYNNHGQLIREVSLNFESIDVASLPKGIYTISFETETNSYFKQFIRE